MATCEDHEMQYPGALWEANWRKHACVHNSSSVFSTHLVVQSKKLALLSKNVAGSVGVLPPTAEINELNGCKFSLVTDHTIW